MIEAAVDEGPVHLPFEYPETQEQAISNMLAFSVPRQNTEQRLDTASPRAVISRLPPLPKCYGWLDFKFNRDLAKRIPFDEWPRPNKRDKPPHSMPLGYTYHAIVYEYISEERNEPELIKASLRFFYLTGFCFTGSPRIKNWKGGRLIDGSDIISPVSVYWRADFYGSPIVAAALLNTNKREEVEEWLVSERWLNICSKLVWET